MTEEEIMGALNFSNDEWDALPDKARGVIAGAFEDRADLLEALKAVELIADWEGPATADYLNTWAKVRAAIAKAKGI